MDENSHEGRFIILPADYSLPILKKIIGAFLYILLFPALLFLLAGDWDWHEGWVFTIWFLLLCYTTIMYLYRKDPALLAERYRMPGTGNQEPKDRFVVFGLVVGFIFWIAIMPLDAKRFGWSPVFPLWLQFLGVVMLALSFFFFFRSYVDNTFLSALVRIQKERRQTVVSTGVYALVRHPMYLGGVLMFLGTPPSPQLDLWHHRRSCSHRASDGKGPSRRSNAFEGTGRIRGLL